MLVVWILAIIGITVVAQVAGTHFQNKFTSGDTPSQQAADILQARFPSEAGDTADVVFRTSTPIAANEDAINQVVDSLRPLAHVQQRDEPVLTGRRPPGLHPLQHRLCGRCSSTPTTANLPAGAINDVV